MEQLWWSKAKSPAVIFAGGCKNRLRSRSGVSASNEMASRRTTQSAISDVTEDECWYCLEKGRDPNDPVRWVSTLRLPTLGGLTFLSRYHISRSALIFENGSGGSRSFIITAPNAAPLLAERGDVDRSSRSW